MAEEADSNESKILEEPVIEAEASSCDDIPEFAVLCSFIDRFGAQIGIPSSIKEVQCMLEQQTNVSEQLVDIHVKLLRKVLSGASKTRFERHLAKFCEGYLVPYNYTLITRLQEEGYSKIDLAAKVHILTALLEIQFDVNTKFKQLVNEKTAEELRLMPLGRDVDGMVYWLQVDEDLNVRLFREDLDDEHSFKLLHKTKEELSEFVETLKKMKGEKFKGENVPKKNTTEIKEEEPETKPVASALSEKEIKTEVENETVEPKIEIKKELEEKKETVEDLCVRQSEVSRSSGENQATVKTKLENEAHCPQPVKTDAPTDGLPEAAHAASSKEVRDGVTVDTPATDLSLPHLPTPPHEQEQRLPAAPQSAVHSPPVPHKKSSTDDQVEDDKTDHTAEDLRTGKKDEENEQTNGNGETTNEEDKPAQQGAQPAQKDDEKQNDDGNVKTNEEEKSEKKTDDLHGDHEKSQDEEQKQDLNSEKKVKDSQSEETEEESQDRADKEPQTEEKKVEPEAGEEEDEEKKPKRRGRKPRAKANQEKPKTEEKAKPFRGRRARNTQEESGKEEEEDEEVPKIVPKKLSREARALLEAAERLRKAEGGQRDADDFSGRPRRSCRVRREVEKYAVSDDESSKRKRKSKAEKEEEKEIVFVSGKNAKAARKAAREMIKAQKLAQKELMRKLKGRKKRGKKGEYSDEDDVDSDLFAEEEEEDDDEELVFDNDEDEFACDEEIDGEFRPEEVKKARTAKKDDQTQPEDDESCLKCNKSDHPEFILLCDTCDAGYHMSCLKPALMVIPLGNWYCPPCEHDALLLALNEKMSFIETEWEKRQREITRKQRLAFVSINIGNVLGPSKRESTKKTFAQDFDDESEVSEDESSDEDDRSDRSSDQPRRRRAARKSDAIREKMQEYDKIMKQAIEDEDEEDGEEIERREAPVRKRSGKDMSNILPESDEEQTAGKTKRRRKSKLSDLNAADSEEDDDSEFQASDFSEIEINKKKRKRGGKRKRRFGSDDDEEDSEAGSDASWGRANIKSSRRTASRRKNPLAREKSSRKGASKWDAYDSEASQSFEASSDDSGDFCKPRKRQQVNYAESSDEEQKPVRSARKKKPSDDEVSINEEEEEEEEEEVETPEEDVSNEDENGSGSNDDDDDEVDEEEDDDDDEEEGEDSDGVVRKKKKSKESKKQKKAAKKNKKKPAPKSAKSKSKAKKRPKEFSDDDSEASNDWSAKPIKKSKKQGSDDGEEEEVGQAADEDAEDQKPRRNGRAEAARARSKLRIASDDEEDENEEQEEEEEDDAPKAWPPLPSHLMANINKNKKQATGASKKAGSADSPDSSVNPVEINHPVQSQSPSNRLARTPPHPVSPQLNRAPLPRAPGLAPTISNYPEVTPPALHNPGIPHVVGSPLNGRPPVVYPPQYVPGATPPGPQEMGQFYPQPGYGFPQYGYPTHHAGAPPMPGYPPAAAYGAPPGYAGHESFPEWGPSAPQAQAVGAAVEEKPSENFSISNILQQGDGNEEIDPVASIGNLMSK